MHIFDRLPLDAVLKRLNRYASIASVSQKGAGKGPGLIIQITVFPKGGGPGRPSAALGLAVVRERSRVAHHHVGEATLSQELHTVGLPRPHVLVGYWWQNTRLCH